MPSVRKVKQVMPPNAAMYWSCLPIGSPSRSISMWQACSASSRGWTMLRAWACRARSSAVVKLPDEPSPVPAGISASVVISICGVAEIELLERLAHDGMLDLVDRLDVLDAWNI